MKKLQVVLVTAVLFSLMCAASAIQAQDQSHLGDTQDQLLPKGKKAKTMPNSETIITLRFSLENGDSLIASQRDGGMIKIEKDGKVLGFTPYKSPDGNVAVRVFRIDRVFKEGKLMGERMIEQETFDFSNSIVNFKDENFPSMIELKSIRDGHQPSSSQKVPPPHTNKPQADECCISCNGVSACACAVYTSCGECCIWGCC